VIGLKHYQPFPELDNARGSFTVAGVFFLVVFLLVAGFGVDLANYLNRMNKLQQIADGAAMAGGNGLSQFADVPAVHDGYQSVIDYIRSTQGDTAAKDLYSEMKEDSGDSLMLGRDVNGRILIRGPLNDGNGDTLYRVGVIVYGTFEPYFLPRQVFGDRVRLLQQKAVAQVRGTSQSRITKIPLNCGLIVGESDTSTGVHINGNNWTMDDGDLCSNAPIDFDKGKDDDFLIKQYKNSPCSDDGNSCPDRLPLSEIKEHASFKHSDPGLYEVELSNFATWPACSSPHTGSFRMQTKSGHDVTWGDGGDPVCVDFDGSRYSFPNETSSAMGVDDGSFSAVSLFSDQKLLFSVNGSGIKGGLYSTGDIQVDGNNHNFTGKIDELGGLSMYSEGSIRVTGNNSVFQGVFGAEEDLIFTNSGGGQNELIGQVMAADEFRDEANSNPVTDITHDTSVFDPEAVDLGGWEESIEEQLNTPYLANVDVRLLR